MKTNFQFLRFTTILFISWLLTLPFGANLLPVSLGFLTIYPNFILTFSLLPLAFLNIKKWNKLETSVLGFLFIWLLFSIFQGQKIGFPKEVIFDIRSLLMQFLFAVTLVCAYHFIEKKQFIRLLIIGLQNFWLVLFWDSHLHFSKNSKLPQIDLFQSKSGIYFHFHFTSISLDDAFSVFIPHYSLAIFTFAPYSITTNSGKSILNEREQ